MATWQGTVPLTDDFGDAITDTFIDGKTRMGPWAFMTPASHATHGVGLGTGQGQAYSRTPEGKWTKIAG